jgi:hypothetical protein
LVCLGYTIWGKKPILFILVTSIFANVITQSFLWVVLHIFFQHYRLTLLIAEILIWIAEGIFLYGFRVNQLSLKESLFLSFAMNLSSFGIGLFLPL